MTDAPLAIVLAAGLSTRMRSKTPKVLHSIAGRPLIAHVLETVRAVGARPLVVLSRESEAARALLDGARVAVQDPARGTGDAVRVALEHAEGENGVAYIVYGDTPLVRPETLARLRALLTERAASLAILSADVGTDNAYGRVVRDGQGDVARIVEARVASPAERALPESILGAYAVDLPWLRSAISRLRENETGEIFLTALVAEATREGRRVAVHRTADPEEGLGVNTRVELAAAEGALRRRIRESHMLAGVTFRDPESCQVDAGVSIAADVVIERGTILAGKTVIGVGTVTVNYDGVRKHRTVVGDDAFIGSDTPLRAPVTIGAGATTGAGAVVTRDVPEGMVAVGMPARAIKRADRRAKGRAAPPDPSAASGAAGSAPKPPV